MSEKHSHKKSYYNDIALRLAHKLLGVEHLHYGYFDGNKKPELKNLPAAQDAYVKNLISYIPAKGVKKIFDVGCGSGGVATVLVKQKYQLTCLAPDPYLTQKTFENTSGKVETITDMYENVTHLPAESFDMVLMSESVQYIKIQEGWELNRKYVRPGGYVLASDFFLIRELDNPNLSKSGHPLDEYLKMAEKAGFTLKKKVDITSKVAPTMDIYQSVIVNKVFPVAEAIFEIVHRRYPFVYAILKKVLQKRILKLRDKYTTQDSETFSHYKGYFILLFQKNGK